SVGIFRNVIVSYPVTLHDVQDPSYSIYLHVQPLSQVLVGFRHSKHVDDINSPLADVLLQVFDSALVEEECVNRLLCILLSGYADVYLGPCPCNPPFNFSGLYVMNCTMLNCYSNAANCMLKHVFYSCLA